MELFTIGNFFTLLMLILLQAVLGFDNLLYISIESKRAPPESQASVRRWGIGMAVGLRLVLLFVVMRAIESFQTPWFRIDWTNVLECEVSFEGIIVLFGGGFIIYTAFREIAHMLAVEDLEHFDQKKPASVAKIVASIVIMNLVFSFDSILSALALTKVFMVMAAAIVISGMMMIWLANHVSEFLQRNRMYEVLGLFILFIVGIMLLSEGGHKAQLTLFGHPVHAMAKSTFYFVIAVLVVVDLVQSRYQKKLLAQKRLELTGDAALGPV